MAITTADLIAMGISYLGSPLVQPANPSVETKTLGISYMGAPFVSHYSTGGGGGGGSSGARIVMFVQT